MTEEGQFYLLEANPNPQIAHREDFADSAEHSGVPYDQLLQKIMTVGMNYAGRGVTWKRRLIGTLNTPYSRINFQDVRSFCPMTLVITLLFTLNLISQNSACVMSLQLSRNLCALR